MRVLFLPLGILFLSCGINNFMLRGTSTAELIFSAVCITAGILFIIYSRSISRPLTDQSHTVPPKSRSVSSLLCLFLGLLGIHKFYLGKAGEGCIYAIMSVAFFWSNIVRAIMCVLSIIDLILILSYRETDSRGRRLV